MTPSTTIPLSARVDIATLRSDLHVKPERDLPADLQLLIHEAEEIARPKALYKIAYIEQRDGDRLWLDGVPFTSRILSVNLQPVNRAFPYILTCGSELEAWAKSSPDHLIRFYADAVQESILHTAYHDLAETLQQRHETPPLSAMNPGSLTDWPMSEQIPLFELLGDPEKEIGVSLTSSLLMKPVKSVSGIFFASENSFASCQLCPRENCPNRRAPFDPDLYARKYA